MTMRRPEKGEVIKCFLPVLMPEKTVWIGTYKRAERKPVFVYCNGIYVIVILGEEGTHRCKPDELADYDPRAWFEVGYLFAVEMEYELWDSIAHLETLVTETRL